MDAKDKTRHPESGLIRPGAKGRKVDAAEVHGRSAAMRSRPRPASAGHAVSKRRRADAPG